MNQIEPRDRDGFLAKDRPQDIVRDMPKSAAHEAALQDALNERDSLAYQALGLLKAMLVTGNLSMTAATQIVDDYESINTRLVAMLASKP